jgi:hypothetical protein
MRSVVVTGVEAKRVVLRHKLAVAEKRALYAPSKAVRESEAAAAERYASELAKLS